MNRQTFLFLVLLIIFLDLPRGGVEENLDENALVLATYKNSLKASQQRVLDGAYTLGYGNLTGLQLSYDDALQNRNVSRWPFRKYSAANPWKELQKHSILPDVVSGSVRLFWATDTVADNDRAYMLNILSHLYGEFSVRRFNTPLKAIPMPLPPYLKDFYNSFRQARYEEEKQRYEEDPENNLPPQEVPEEAHKTGNITSYTLGPLTLRIETLASMFPELNPGRLGLEVHEDTTLLHVEVELSNHAATDRNTFKFFALYFQDTGSLVGVTRSAKFMGTHAMPHFTMNESNFNRLTTLILRLLALSDIDKDITLSDVVGSVERAETLCEAVMFLQLEKTNYTRDELRFIDDELKLRQGYPIPKPLPEVVVKDAVIYSPDCGLVFEKSPEVPLQGIKTEVRLSKLRLAFVGMFFLTLLELNLFMRQAKASRTPSDLSNISTMCIGLLSGYDLIVALLMMLIMWVTDLYLICACNTVLNILLFYVFELRFLASIEASQLNERGVSWRQIIRGSTRTASANEPPRDLEAQTPTTGTAGQGSTVGATNAPPPPPPVTPAPAPAATPTGPSTGSVMPFFTFSLVFAFGITMLILSATSWSVRAALIGEYSLLLFMNSFWVPQFIRNTLKNRPKSLQWEFVVGTSFVRLLPVAYLCLYQSNPFRHPYRPALFLTVFSWQALQIFLLYLQSRIGARFWLNSKWLPEQYNYHPVISLKDLEKGFSRDILNNLKVVPDQESSMYESDCAICMSSLKFPVLMKENANKKPYEAQMKHVMITPCYHSFHTECLEDWMIYKLQCPVCRTALPPI